MKPMRDLRSFFSLLATASLTSVTMLRKILAVVATVALFMASLSASQATTITAWTFENDAIATANNPAASTGTGTASSLNMDVYPTPNVGVNTCDVLAGKSADTGANGKADTSHVWRVRAQAGSSGAANGWSSLAPIGTQGAQFAASAVGYINLNVSFDWYTTSAGEANLQLQYTTDGATWQNVPLTLGSSYGGISVLNNSSSSHTVIGSYVQATAQDWFPGLTGTINDTAAANNPNFAIRMVNASTGTDCVDTTGVALNNSSGNWRFDNVVINGTAAPLPVITGAATAAAFTSIYGSASSVQTFAVSGANLTANLVASAPTGFELSSDGTTYGNTASFAPSGGNASGTLRVRLAATATVSGSYNSKNIVLSTTGATSVNITTATSGNSVSARALTITANDVSTPLGTPLSSPVTGSTAFTSSGLVNGDTINSVTITYGSHASATTGGSFPGEVTPSSALGSGLGNYSITYNSGTLNVTTTPTITVTGGPLQFGTVAINTTSAEQTYTVAGRYLTAPIAITPPANFEISTTSGSGFVANPASLQLTPASGTVGTTTVYVHFKPAATQTYSGVNITHTTAGGNSPSVAVTGAGANAPSVTTQAASSITASGAVLNGTVTAANNTPITDRGFYYQTTPGVTTSSTKADEGGTAVSSFNKALTGLSPNQVYYYRAYAVNVIGTTLDAADTSFYTLANTPTAPLVGLPTATTLNVVIGSSDGNPASTTYAIQETGSGKFVQATTGALGTAAVFQTAAAWAAQQPTVTGLAQGQAFTFQVEAQNGAGVNTVFGPALKASTLPLPFTPGNLAVLSPDNGTAAATTFSVIEINPNAVNQPSPVQTIAINGTVGTPGTALTMGTSATSGGLSSSSDGTLLVFPGYNTTDTASGANTILRGVGTLNNAGQFALPATYSGIAANQTRSATTLDNQHFIWADKGGVYTNGATAPSDAQNVLRVKSFGGTVYVLNQQGWASVVSTLSANASTLYPLPNYPTAKDGSANDFYLVSSGNNGSIFDVLYQLDASTATAGTILKYSLVSGQWIANGSYATSFGGCGICAAKSGSGATLYVVTGLGTAANNQVEKLTDSAGYNAAISITVDGSLYTAPGTTSLKSVTFAPVSYSVAYNGNQNTGGSAPTDTQVYGSGAAVTELGNTGNLTRTGYVFAGWNNAADGSGAYSSGGMNFNITSNTTFYAVWVPINSPQTDTVEVGSTVTFTVDPAQPPFSTIAPPYGYQWYFGSTPLAGQTGASLTLTDVQLAASGSYSVVVSNSTSSAPGISDLVAVLTVVDTHPPVLSLPPNMTVFTGSGGVTVTYSPAPTAYSAAVGSVPVISTPPSGSLFSPGTTLVNCTASDGLGNASSGSFTVTVITTNATTNIVVNGVTYLPYSTNLAVGTWVWLDTDPANGSLMRDTQRLLGEDEVNEKGLLFAGLAFSQVTPSTNGSNVTYDYSAQSGKNTYTVGQLVNKFDPILIGPDGLAYITDGHHTMAAYLLPVSPVHDLIPGYHRVAFGQITENLAGQGTINDAWWEAREVENNAYLYGTNGDQLIFPGEPDYAASQPILPSVGPMPTTPSELNVDGSIPMVNDDGRSLGWGVRQGIIPSAYNAGGPIVGYANTAPDGSAINFVDFFWADFFRNRVVWNNRLTPTGNGDANAINAPLSFFAASANGIALGKSELYRDQNGRSLFDYTNLATYANYTTNANTVAWANTAIANGLAAVGDTYNLYLRDDSSIAGDIIPSALSANLLHIDTAAGLTVTQLVTNMNYLLVNMGAQFTTIFPDAFVPNSTLTFPAGTGAVSLNDAAYVGTATVVSNGTCSVNGVLNSPVVTVLNGSTLAGTGTINGAVTVQTSATLAPGNASIGTLAVNGPLTLAGTTAMEINKTGATLTGDWVTGVTTLNYGGTLTVTASGDALVGGETFTLFSAGHYAGAFAAMNLPALATGLHWDVSQLAQNGTLRVLGVGPVANTAYYARAANVSLKIYLSDLLADVTDANGFTVSFVGVGTDGLNNLTATGATLQNYGAFIGYTNSAPPNLNDRFEYTVSDGHGSTATGTVVITMNNNLFGQTNVSLTVGAGSVTANFFGVPGYRYSVERSTNLTTGVGLGWVPISTNTAPAGGLIQVIDSFSDLGITVPPVPSPAFYRLRYNP